MMQAEPYPSRLGAFMGFKIIFHNKMRRINHEMSQKETDSRGSPFVTLHGTPVK